VLKPFILAFVTFVGLIVPATFALAPPVRPEPVQPPGCDRTLATPPRLGSKASALQPTRNFYRHAALFLEVAKARAVTALCKSGAERERALGVSTADVEHINEAIATHCSWLKLIQLVSQLRQSSMA
jgi:hypothetical protein